MVTGLIGISWRIAIWTLVLFLATATVSLALVGAVLVLLPATYFLDSHQRDIWIDRHPAIRWSAKILKNACGWCLILIGIILSLPGVPGQGLLMILVGLLLVDFPDKRHLERRLLGRRGVAERINRLRARFGRPALILQEEHQG
jgi:hypothetical protein